MALSWTIKKVKHFAIFVILLVLNVMEQPIIVLCANKDYFWF
jgi:hypothetical protein